MKKLATLTTSLIVLLGLSVAFDAVGCKQKRHFLIYVQGYSGEEIPNIRIEPLPPHIRKLEYKGGQFGKNNIAKDAYSVYESFTCAGSKRAKINLIIEGKTIVFAVTGEGEIVPQFANFPYGVQYAYSDKNSGPNNRVLVVHMKKLISKP